MPDAVTHSNSGTKKLGLRDARVERDWARLGVLFNCRASPKTPDLERLLLDTARVCPDNALLLPLVVTWLSQYGQFVARHRLKRLVQSELGLEHSATLGLIVEQAITAGGTRELLIVSEACEPHRPEGPLSQTQRAEASLAKITKRHASEASARWGVWTPPGRAEAGRDPAAGTGSDRCWPALRSAPGGPEAESKHGNTHIDSGLLTGERPSESNGSRLVSSMKGVHVIPEVVRTPLAGPLLA